MRSAIYPVLENDGFLEHRRTAFVTDHRVAPREQANAEMGPAEPPVAPAEPAEAPPAPPMELAYKEVIVSNAPAPAYIPPPEVRVLARQKMSILREEDKQDGYISSLSKNAGIDPDAKCRLDPAYRVGNGVAMNCVLMDPSPKSKKSICGCCHRRS